MQFNSFNFHEINHFIKLILEERVDEQITKIYSQVIQACFIPFEESSVTEKKRLTTNIKEKWRFNIFPKKENISASLISGDYFHNL